MKFATTLLWLNAVLFIIFGMCFLVAPGFFANLITEAIPATSSACIDMRATYGGMGLGIGLVFALCARHPATVSLGLIASLMVLGAIVAGRLIGFVVDGSPNLFMSLMLSAELLFIVLLVVALKQMAISPQSGD
jgi:hypothetical protein